MKPICQFLILCGLILGKTVAVQNGDLVGNHLIIASADILNGFPHQIADLEGYDLISTVLDHIVLNLRADFLFTVQNRLPAFVVGIEIFHIRFVRPMCDKCLSQHVQNIVPCDLRHIGKDFLTTETAQDRIPPLYLFSLLSLYQTLQWLSILTFYHTIRHSESKELK